MLLIKIIADFVNALCTHRYINVAILCGAGFAVFIDFVSSRNWVKFHVGLI